LQGGKPVNKSNSDSKTLLILYDKPLISTISGSLTIRAWIKVSLKDFVSTEP
jgi:hypothetical protein